MRLNKVFLRSAHKLLILLSFILLFTAEERAVKTQKEIPNPKPTDKGPVYNPLRAKPYTKYTLKA